MSSERRISRPPGAKTQRLRGPTALTMRDPVEDLLGRGMSFARSEALMDLHIAFRGMEPSQAVESRIRQRAEKLERYHDRITACRVVVDAPHRRHTKGERYTVRVDLTVPGHEIVVNRDSGGDRAHEDVYAAVRDAFDAAGRQLEDTVRIARGDVKHHDARLTERPRS